MRCPWRSVPARLTAVLGPNGAGKSSLVRLLSGETTPDLGKVTLDGRDLKRWDRRDLARRRAVLSQSVSLTFPLSVAEVVMLGRAPHRARSTRAEDMAAAEASLKAADVWHLAGRAYPTLSGGERQRVQFARVLAQLEDGGQSGTRYLILDEPTSSLDIRHQARLLGLAGGLARKGWGVLAVLHDRQPCRHPCRHRRPAPRRPHPGVRRSLERHDPGSSDGNLRPSGAGIAAGRSGPSADHSRRRHCRLGRVSSS